MRQGARTIGLIDGLYGDCAAVWHKEILFALSSGIAVFGAASMGALRAAECEAFGMIGIGDIFEAYRDSHRVSDADVAVSHAPGELGYRPLTIALVDAEATLAACGDAITPKNTTRSPLPRAPCILPAGPGAPSPLKRVSAPNGKSARRQRGIHQTKRCSQTSGGAQGEPLPSPVPQSWKLQNTLFFQQLAARRVAGEEAS